MQIYFTEKHSQYQQYQQYPISTTIYTAKPTYLPVFLQWLGGKQTLSFPWAVRLKTHRFSKLTFLSAVVYAAILPQIFLKKQLSTVVTVKTNGYVFQQHLKSSLAILISLYAGTESNNFNTKSLQPEQTRREKNHTALTLSNKHECCQEKERTMPNKNNCIFLSIWERQREGKVTLI